MALFTQHFMSHEFYLEIEKRLGYDPQTQQEIYQDINTEVSTINSKSAKPMSKKEESAYRLLRLKDLTLDNRDPNIRRLSNQAVNEALLLNPDIRGLIPGSIAMLLSIPNIMQKSSNATMRGFGMLLDIPKTWYSPIVKTPLNAIVRAKHYSTVTMIEALKR